MAIRFVAIVDAKNEPIYFKSANDAPHEVQVNHQFIAEMSLDFVEEKAPQLEASLRAPLMVVLYDGIAVYAMLSNTKIKYLMGVDATAEAYNVGEAMNAVVNELVAYQCNPFGAKQGPIKSPQFEQRINAIISTASQ